VTGTQSCIFATIFSLLQNSFRQQLELERDAALHRQQLEIDRQKHALQLTQEAHTTAQTDAERLKTKHAQELELCEVLAAETSIHPFIQSFVHSLHTCLTQVCTVVSAKTVHRHCADVQCDTHLLTRLAFMAITAHSDACNCATPAFIPPWSLSLSYFRCHPHAAPKSPCCTAATMAAVSKHSCGAFQTIVQHKPELQHGMACCTDSQSVVQTR